MYGRDGRYPRTESQVCVDNISLLHWYYDDFLIVKLSYVHRDFEDLIL
jgi:hypothetical protein